LKNSIRRITATLFAAAMVSMGSASHAQNTTQGALAGTIFDATNAAIPGAKIVVHNTANNADTTVMSGTSGEFKTPGLAPGNYTVTVTMAGFEPLHADKVLIENNETTEFTEHMTAGGESTVVEVSAATPVLNFESAEFGGHLESSEIESVPINNRRWSTLVLVTPAATLDTNGYGLISFRAISPLLNNVEIDGADDNEAFFSEERGRTRAGYSTSQAMVQEFTVNTGVYSAEFGRAVGGVVNSVTKSGGNQIHGEAYFYNRKSSRASYLPFSTNTTYNATTGAYVTSPFKPSDNRNEYGFQAGGALKKDKLFWAFAFDEYKRNFPGDGKANNPATFFAAPTAATLTLLATRLGVTSAVAATDYNNQLQALLGDLGAVPRFGDQEINTPKLDYQINSKEHVSILYHRLRWDSPGGVQTQGTNTYAIDTFGTDFVKLDYSLVKLDSVINNHFSNEARYQYGRELLDEGRQPVSAYTSQYLNNSTGIPTQVALQTAIGFTLGTPYYSFRPAYPDERKWQVGDTANYQLGKHSIKFGEDIVHNHDLQNNLFEGNGAYTYSTIVNYVTDIYAGAKGTCDSSGSSTGTFPCYSSYAQSFGQPRLQLATLDWGVFVQDDWKVAPRLTLNLGMRYDNEILPQPFAANSAIPQTTSTPKDNNNFAPRVGMAWDPFGKGKTTVHAGYGMYYGRIFNSLLLNALENTGTGVSATGTSTSQAAYSFSSTTAGAPFLPSVATTLPPAGAIGPSTEYLDSHLQNPYAHEFDLAVQQDIGFNTIISISYLGALGRELTNYLNLDLNPTSTYTIPYTVAAGTNGSCGPAPCGTIIPVKVYASKLQTGSSASTYNYTPLLNPTYNGITDVISNLNSSYHALTAEIQHRQGKYMTFDANSTWSDALDFNQSVGTTYTAGSTNWFDPYGNARANYGKSLQNVPSRVVAYAIVNAPGVSEGRALHYLTNGWSVKPLLQYQSGLPYSVIVSGTTPNQCSVAGCLEVAGSGLSGTGVTYIPYFGRNSRQYPSVAIVDARVEKDFGFEGHGHNYTLQLLGEAFNLVNHQNVTGVNTTGYALTSSIGTTPGATTSTLTYQPTFGAITSANSTYQVVPRQIQISARITF